ncbi:MAG: hypothetical protein ABI415_02535 [Flavitalea sp.]
MGTRTIHAEALLQTPDQQMNGTVTYRVFTDEAWRNVEGLKEWMHLTPLELLQLVEEVYIKNKKVTIY